MLNQPAYAGRAVLVAGPDFGTGSSREHAVWALRDYGFKAVLSPRFGDIFRGNSGKQGLLTGTVTEEDIEQLWARDRGRAGIAATVDLVARRSTVGDLDVPLSRSTTTLDGGCWRASTTSGSPCATKRGSREFEADRESWRPRTLPVRS